MHLACLEPLVGAIRSDLLAARRSLPGRRAACRPTCPQAPPSRRDRPRQPTAQARVRAVARQARPASQAPAPVADAEITAAIERGVDFLLKDQNADGSWGSPERTKDLNIIAGIGSHHAFRTAVTALCVSALIEVSEPAEQAVRPDARSAAPSNAARSSCSASCPWSAATARC